MQNVSQCAPASNPEIHPFRLNENYGLSKCGRVFTKYIHNRHSAIGDDWREVNYYVNKAGYPCVTMRGMRTYCVHRVMALHFLGDPPEGKHLVAHGDGNPGNNRIENLRWADYKENEDDKLKHGRRPRGESSPTSKLTEQQAIGIVNDWATGNFTQYDLAKKYGLEQCSISCVVTGKNWGWLDLPVRSTYVKHPEDRIEGDWTIPERAEREGLRLGLVYKRVNSELKRGQVSRHFIKMHNGRTGYAYRWLVDPSLIKHDRWTTRRGQHVKA